MADCGRADWKVLLAAPTYDVDDIQQQALHKGWQRYLLCFQSSQLEREFLESHAGKVSALSLVLISQQKHCTMSCLVFQPKDLLLISLNPCTPLTIFRHGVDSSYEQGSVR